MNSTRFPFLCLGEASEHWVLAPSALSSQSLILVNLPIICANALMTGSMEGARAGMTSGGVIAKGGPKEKGVALEFPIGY